MNKENMKRLVESIRSSTTFTMREFMIGEHPCGSPACIAGHASSLMEGHLLFNSLEDIREFLGLSREEMGKIYLPSFSYADFRSRIWNKGFISKAHAINMLEKFIETGEVDWEGTRISFKSRVYTAVGNFFVKKKEVQKKQEFDMKSWLEQIKPEEAKEHEEIERELEKTC